VIAQGLAPSSVYQVMLCGDDARRGSADCDLVHAQTRTTSATGGWGAEIGVAIPPAPCPCVAAAFPNNGATPTTAPIDIVGAPVAPLAQVGPQLTLTVLSLHLEGLGPLQAWFGGSPGRTLVLTIKNNSGQDQVNPPIFLAVGKGPNPSQLVNAPPLGTIAAGATATLRIPVSFPLFAFGTYTLSGTVGYADSQARFSARTLLLPWGLIGIGLAVLLLVAFWLYRRLRRWSMRRRQVKAGPVGPLGGTEEEGQTGAPEGMDLAGR
jgi:hypothetical protein